MKVAVIGAGALGTLIGGYLATVDCDVHMIHRRESVATKLEQDGVRVVDGDDGTARQVEVAATTDASTVGPVDLTLVVVKTYQTKTALTQHSDCVGPETQVLSLQNGLESGRELRDVVGDDRTLVGVTYQGATLEAPGLVHHTHQGPTTFGGTKLSIASRFAETFESAGLSPTHAVRDPLPAVWEKQLWGIAIKPIAALTRLSNGEIVDDDSLVHLQTSLIEEARSVAAARGIHPPEEVHDDILESLRDSPHHSSMLQDVEASRRTEIDAINGAVAKLATEEGLEAPYNALIADLVRGLQNGYLSDQ